jgi:hypothetical protein
MRCGRVAWLVLMGWYLIVPHLVSGTFVADLSIPVSSWYFYNDGKAEDQPTRSNARVFPSEEACKETLERHLEFARKFERVTRGMSNPGVIEVWAKAACISEDDPRLTKSN